MDEADHQPEPLEVLQRRIEALETKLAWLEHEQLKRPPLELVAKKRRSRRTPPPPNPDDGPARSIATRLTMMGRPRAEIVHILRDTYGVPDAEELLDSLQPSARLAE